MLLKFVIPAVNHSSGPSVAKYALALPSKRYPKKAARPIDMIAEPGNAKATGKPDANAAIMINTSKDKNKCSII